LFDWTLILELKDKFSQRLGKRVIKPKAKIIPPDIHFQKPCGVLTKKVLALRIRVKRITETPRDEITTNILLLLKVESEIDVPTITGKSGNMHGAKIVKTPAIKEMIKSVMIFLI